MGGHRPVVVDLEQDGYSVDDIVVHDKSDKMLALMLSELTYMPDFPTPLGIIYQEQQDTYEELVHRQIEAAVEQLGKGDLQALLHEGQTTGHQCFCPAGRKHPSHLPVRVRPAVFQRLPLATLVLLQTPGPGLLLGCNSC